MKAKEIRELANSDLLEKIAEEKALLNKLKLNHSVSPIENPLKITYTRKNIARLNTELRNRELNKNVK